MIDEALALCRGSYQRDLVMGQQAWSGADLRGKAREYGMSYRRSRRNLIRRLEEAKVAYLTIVAHGEIVMELGRPPGYYIETEVACGRAWVPGPKTILDEVVEALDEVD